jgi:beta-1,4-mannosyltransferase
MTDTMTSEAAPPGYAAPQGALKTVTIARPRVWPAAQPQGRRDWGLIATVTAVLTAAIGGLYAAQHYLWPHAAIPASGLARAIDIAGQVAWCMPVAAGVLGVAGMFSQRRQPRPDPDPTPLLVPVCFRYVTRGSNPESLASAVASVYEVMGSLPPLFAFTVEVVTESLQPGLPPQVTQMVIPARQAGGYYTPNGTLYKGRALQYAMEHSTLPDEAWIMHMDEESHLHPSLAWGMWRAVAEEEASGEYRIGQGAILYYNSLRKHPFLTLADSIRTGDDIGRFHLQNRCWHLPVWGFHGSFILVRNSVEKQTGFDFGPESSVTEDAFWALAQAGAGNRSRWVDGYLVEQGTERISDFIKQRRRWYVGLRKVVRYAPARRALRAPLAAFTALWSVAWLGVIWTYANLYLGYATSPVVQAIGNVSFASYVVIYWVGVRANLRTAKVPHWQRPLWYLAQTLGVLPFSAMEAAGVALAVIKPDKGFHVVQKRMTAAFRHRA